MLVPTNPSRLCLSFRSCLSDCQFFRLHLHTGWRLGHHLKVITGTALARPTSTSGKLGYGLIICRAGIMTIKNYAVTKKGEKNLNVGKLMCHKTVEVFQDLAQNLRMLQFVGCSGPK